jgi:hypothetical protein
MNRPALFAGRYYFPDAGRLRASVESFIEDAAQMRPSTLRQTQGSGQAGDLIALIVPHGPLMEMGPVAGHAYKMLLTTPLRWDVTTLLAPTMHPSPALQCDRRDAYDTPIDPLRIDHDAANALRAAGLPIEEDDDDEPVIECHAPFVLTALGDVPVMPLRAPANGELPAVKTTAAGFGFVIAAANLPAGHEAAACDAIAQLNDAFFAGDAQPKKRSLSSLFGGKSTSLETTADNCVLALALQLAKANGATQGWVLLRKGVYAACALFR